MTAALLGCFAGLCFAQAASDTTKTSPSSSQLAADPQAASIPPTTTNEQREFQAAVKDIHFDFDKAELREEEKATLNSDAQWLKAHPDAYITLEGDADDRGDIVYNLVLSGDRATVTRDSLVNLGVPADHILYATGWGKLYPICSQADESCWSQNRRTHFATWPSLPEASQAAVQISSATSGQ